MLVVYTMNLEPLYEQNCFEKLLDTVKKERMITDEVQRNLGGTIASRYSRLFMRQQACEQINEMFGLNISVDYREDMQVLDTYDANVGKGGENNE